MKKLLLATSVAILSAVTTANAGTELQLQFQRWAGQSNGTVRLMVTQRNPTMKPFHVSSWDCTFRDETGQPVGRSPITFYTVPWGAIIVESVTVLSGMFQDGDCKLAYVEPVTWENEKINRVHSAYSRMTLGLALPEVDQYWSFDHKIQGRSVVISEKEENEIAANIESYKGKKPGYRD